MHKLKEILNGPIAEYIFLAMLVGTFGLMTGWRSEKLS